MQKNHEFITPVLGDLSKRGILRQCTDASGLDALMSRRPVVAYAGFDATADGLHVGHLVTLTTLGRLAAAGHKVIALVGGGTTLVGDPSFRDKSRPMMNEDGVRANIFAVKRDITNVLSRFSKNFEIVDNAEWLAGIGFLDFMRDVGRHFTVARMLSMDSVKGRMADGNSLTALEFSYMMLQAFDFAELARNRECLLQVGGSDQWGNIVNGVELARRRDGRELFGLTTELLTTADGRKMGKSADGAVWLSAEKLAPFEFRQFWRNVDDRDVLKFSRMFTDIPDNRVDGPISSQENVNVWKSELADAMTRLVHGTEEAEAAARRAKALFEGEGAIEITKVPSPPEGMDIPTLLVSTGISNSKGHARRLIDQRGVRIGDQTIENWDSKIATGSKLTISVGKRRKIAIKLVPAGRAGS